MNAADQTLPPEARTLLNQHLDAVDRALADSGVPRSERRTICEEVESQACEMLRQRAPGEPTEQDVQAILAEMDDPESFRQRADAAPQLAAAPTPSAVKKILP